MKVSKPFIIGIYFGNSKPSNAKDFLLDYVVDLQKMKTVGYRGIFIKKVVYPLDAPALAFVKGVQSHSGKNSCNKCTIVGLHKSRRVCFPIATNNSSRTDEGFRSRIYGEHHKNYEPGPLECEELETDMVMDFPIDPLHAMDLGLMKKLVSCWMGSKRYGNSFNTFQLKLTAFKISEADDHLNYLRQFQPSDFNRKSRALSIYKYWKGAEFSCLLNYTGPVVFQNILHEEVYENFLLLYVISTICGSKEHSDLWPLAKPLSEACSQSYKKIYGDYAVSYYVHNLLHICEDIEHLQVPMSEYSTLSFESKLGVMKKLVRGGNRRLEQVANRVEATIETEIQDLKLQLNDLIDRFRF